MKTLFLSTVLTVLSIAVSAQNNQYNQNNPDPQNGEHGSNPAINTSQSKDPLPQTYDSEGYPTGIAPIQRSTQSMSDSSKIRLKYREYKRTEH